MKRDCRISRIARKITLIVEADGIKFEADIFIEDLLEHVAAGTGYEFLEAKYDNLEWQIRYAMVKP